MCLNSVNHVKKKENGKPPHGINATLAELSSSRAKKNQKKQKIPHVRCKLIETTVALFF